MTKPSKLRRKAYNQEEQLVRAVYPTIFSGLRKLLTDETCDAADVRSGFESVCQAIQEKLNKQIGKLKKPLAKRRPGRPRDDLSAIQNDLRFYVYILVRDMKGLGWWEHIEPLIERKTPGRRAGTAAARGFADVLFYIVNQSGPATGLGNLLSSNAIADMANQLAYAYRHDVPFPYLLGFLTHVGFDEAARKQRAGGTYERWHPSAKKEAGKSGESGARPKSSEPQD